jgi:hypothetical protein
MFDLVGKPVPAGVSRRDHPGEAAADAEGAKPLPEAGRVPGRTRPEIQLKRVTEQGDTFLPVSAPGQYLPGVLQRRGQGERPRSFFEALDREGELIRAARNQAFCVSSGACDRGDGRVQPKTLPGSRDRGNRELTVAGRHRDPGQRHLIGDIRRIQRHDGETLSLTQRAQMSSCRRGVTFPHGNQSEKPRARALSASRARLKQRPGDGGAFADLRLVPGVHRHAPGRHGSLNVQAAGRRRLLHGGDDPVERCGCLAKPADLQEPAAAAALPFPHSPSMVVSLPRDQAVGRQA